MNALSRPATGDADLLVVCDTCGFADPTNGLGQTGLIIAASLGHLNCLKALMKKNVDTNHLDSYGLAGIHYACSNGHVQCVNALIESKATVDLEGLYGQTGLGLAVGGGELACIRAMVDAGADEGRWNKYGGTYLHTACSTGNVTGLDYMLGRHVNVNHQDHVGQTCLHVASEEGHVNCLNRLIEMKARVDRRDHEGCTGLALAARCGKLSCLRALITANADVNARTYDGVTVLSLASTGGVVVCEDFLNAGDCVSVLIESKACVRAQDGENTFLLARLFRSSNMDPFYTVLSAVVAQDNNSRLMQKILDQALVTALACFPRPEFHSACVALLAAGATASDEDLEYECRSRLAAARRDLRTALVLLVRGAQDDAPCFYDYTPTAMALMRRGLRGALEYVDRWHAITSRALSEDVKVDTRIGLGYNGLYHETLECSLGYLGLTINREPWGGSLGTGASAHTSTVVQLSGSAWGDDLYDWYRRQFAERVCE